MYKQIKNLLLLFTIMSIGSACHKNERTELDCTFFELNECFSTLVLADSQLVITDETSYLEFQNSIRRLYNPSCDTALLPTVDFSNFIFMGAYTASSGCEVNNARTVYYDEDAAKYEYNIAVSSSGDCSTFLASFNCAIVPKQGNSAEVIFKVSY